MIKKTTWVAAALLISVLSVVAMPQEPTSLSAKYKALKCPAAMLGSTWIILERDGANRQVEPYLSSLGLGEAGTGVVTSPPFVIASSTITFTLCGHDGQGGGRGENYIGLAVAHDGKTLVKTEAPSNDAMQERSWEVSKFKGVEVRIEVHDGNSGGAYAWLGVGRIDASPAMKVDFRQGLPKDWERPERAAGVRYELVAGGIPFQRNALAFTLIPKTGTAELPCGFVAERLYFLGCTVGGGKALITYGGIEVHYQTGSPDVFPLMYGFTLDGQDKLLSRSKAMYLHPSADPFQHYLVIAPRDELIEKIRLVANPDKGPIPRITAITCETTAENDHLMPLPESSPSAEEVAWIASHSVSADSPELGQIMQEIRKAHKMLSEAAAPTILFQKHKLDGAFRSEGVAVADFNGDELMDFVTGKRFWAHNGPDPGSYEPAVLCWFEQKRENGRPKWIRHEIDVDSDIGLHFEMVDLDRDGLLDVVISNKRGVYYFQQVRK